MENITSTQMQKIILMLDHEPLMIDRRIMLEAQSLVKAGYRVVLATRSDSIKPHLTFERGVEIRRFPIELEPSKSSVRTIEHDYMLASDWANYHGNLHLEKKIRKRFQNLPWKIQSYLYAFALPPVLAKKLALKIPTLKKIFGKIYEPLIFALLLRPYYLRPYLNIGKDILRKIIRYKLLGISPENNFDLFQLQILNFATNEIKPDFVHAHDLPNLTLALQIAQKHLIPLVYDAHELYPLQFFSNKTRGTELATLERRLIDNTDAVITVNKQCEDILRQTYPNLNDIVILSNATENPINFDPTKKRKLWHERFKLDSSIKIMVFQGGINPVRNVDHLVHALQYVEENIHIGFITYKKDIPYYEALTKKLNIFHRVHYVIEIPWDEVIHWLAAADVGIMPYQASNLNAKISSPNKLFEFMVAGLPIIASTELDNVKAAIDNHHVGVCKLLREDDSYIEAINEMFNPLLGGPERFVANVLAVRHLYTWENEEPRLLELYSRLSQTTQVLECVES